MNDRWKWTVGVIACAAAAILTATAIGVRSTESHPRSSKHPVSLRSTATFPDYSAELARRQLAGHPLHENAFIPLLHAAGETLLPKGTDRADMARRLGLAAWPPVERPLPTLSAFLRRAHCIGRGAEQCERRLSADVMTGCYDGRWASGARDIAAEWLEQAPEAFQHIGEATAKPMLFIPVDEYADERVNVVTMVALHRALVCHGRLQFEAGEIDAAARTALWLWKLGGLVQPDHAFIVYAAGLTAWTSALALTSTLTERQLAPAAAQNMLDALAPLDSNVDATRMVERARIEVPVVLASMSRATTAQVDGHVHPRETVDWDRIEQRVQRAFDTLALAARQPAPQRVHALQEAERQIRSQRVNVVDAYLWCTTPVFPARCRATVADMLGDVVLGGHMLDWGRQIEKAARMRGKLEQARAALARVAARAPASATRTQSAAP